MEEMVCPVANTTLTTAIGFVSFAFSPLRPVQAFGLFTAIGVRFSLFYSLTVVLAMLTLFNPALLDRLRADMLQACYMASWCVSLAGAIARQRLSVLGLVIF